MKPILRDVDKLMAFASAGDAALYSAFMGYFSVLEDKVEAADEHLRRALELCPPGARANRRRIVTLLVPVRLCLGAAPAPALLRLYGLEDLYGGIVRGVTRGDGAAFREAVERHAATFIRLGLFLFIDKLQLLVLRTLAKRVVRILDRNQIHVDVVEGLMRELRLAPSAGGDAVSRDELECLLAVLIKRNLVKGYINHSPLVLILKKGLAAAFPRVAGIPWWVSS